MISSVPPTAPAGRPPEIALASVTMSGTTPKRSTAPPAAVVMPLLTSSKISTMPCFVVSARTASRKPGSGSTTPRFIMTGSMMRQAGVRPSATRRSMRASIIATSLYGTGTVISTAQAGRPVP